jgi:hypothetical protein
MKYILEKISQGPNSSLFPDFAKDLAQFFS